MGLLTCSIISGGGSNFLWVYKELRNAGAKREKKCEGERSLLTWQRRPHLLVYGGLS